MEAEAKERQDGRAEEGRFRAFISRPLTQVFTFGPWLQVHLRVRGGTVVLCASSSSDEAFQESLIIPFPLSWRWFWSHE